MKIIRHGSAIYLAFLLLAACMAALGFVLSSPGEILRGLYTIITTEDTLITDYFASAGAGAALINSAAVIGVSVGLLCLTRDPVTGSTVTTLGLMAGFALFGKNLANMLPIIFGTWLYSVFTREKFVKYVHISLMASTLAPLVSFVAFRQGGTPGHIAMALGVGVVIGFVMPILSSHTFHIQNGMNLFNMGFAGGLLAMVLVSLFKAFGAAPESTYFWSTRYTKVMSFFMGGVFLVLLAAGLSGGRKAVKSYGELIRCRDRAPNDYISRFGAPAVLINMSLCGALALGYVLVSGGAVNGPTVGGIMVVAAFAAAGMNPRNILPVMLGVLLGSALNKWEMDDPVMLLAGLFCTGLAPITDIFGIVPGFAAGFLHSSVVLFAGSPLGGLNLYNNGFSTGLVSIVMYPILSRIEKRREAVLDEGDYTDMFYPEEEDYGEEREPEAEDTLCAEDTVGKD